MLPHGSSRPAPPFSTFHLWHPSSPAYLFLSVISPGFLFL
jgi:hypothetical protein